MSDPLQIFISYASEDQRLVDVIVEALDNSFRRSINLTYMSQFEPGIAYRQEIDKKLDAADVLLVVASGKLKLSHSFTGYEVGFFRRSQETRRLMRDQAQRPSPRIILPIAVLTDQPDTVAEIQGVQLPKENRLFVYFDAKRDAATGSGKVIYDLLIRIDQIIEDLIQSNRNADQSAKTQKGLQAAAELFSLKFDEALRTTPIDQQLPKIKFTVNLPSGWEDHKNELCDVVHLTIHGPTNKIFSSHPRSNCGPWSSFQELLGDSDLALSWKDAIESLILSSVDGEDFANEDQLVLSHDETRVYRLFVSKSTLYFDRSRELDIYVIPIFHATDAGDPLTTYLEKAIGVGLRFRSLFLEINSPYAPVNFRFEEGDDLSRLTRGMLKELRVLLVKSREGRLSTPKHLAALFGTDEAAVTTVSEMTEKWETVKAELYTSAAQILKENSATNKQKLVHTLQIFCLELNKMNKYYLKLAICRLNEIIKSTPEQ